jgi:hypothetical protein
MKTVNNRSKKSDKLLIVLLTVVSLIVISANVAVNFIS